MFKFDANIYDICVKVRDIVIDYKNTNFTELVILLNQLSEIETNDNVREFLYSTYYQLKRRGVDADHIMGNMKHKFIRTERILYELWVDISPQNIKSDLFSDELQLFYHLLISLINQGKMYKIEYVLRHILKDLTPYNSNCLVQIASAIRHMMGSSYLAETFLLSVYDLLSSRGVLNEYIHAIGGVKRGNDFLTIMSIVKQMANISDLEKIERRRLLRNFIRYYSVIDLYYKTKMFQKIVRHEMFNSVGWKHAEIVLRSAYSSRKEIPEWFLLKEQVTQYALSIGEDPKIMFVGMSL